MLILPSTGIVMTGLAAVMAAIIVMVPHLEVVSARQWATDSDPVRKLQTTSCDNIVSSDSELERVSVSH